MDSNVNCSTLGIKGKENLKNKNTLKFDISGQLGLGSEKPIKASLPVAIEGIKGIIRDVGAGSAHSIVVTSKGVYSFGLNDEVTFFFPTFFFFLIFFFFFFENVRDKSVELETIFLLIKYPSFLEVMEIFCRSHVELIILYSWTAKEIVFLLVGTTWDSKTFFFNYS